MFHTRGMYILLLIVLLSGISSCAPQTVTELPAPTSSPTPTPTPTLSPTIEPTLETPPPPADTQAAPTPGISYYLPVGIATFSSTDSQVTYYDLHGQSLGTLQATNLGSGTYQQAHISGPLTLSPSPVLPPLVYYRFENGGEIWSNSNNDQSLLTSAANLFTLIGVPGKPAFAYSLVSYTDSGVRSQVFISQPQNSAPPMQVMDNTNTQSNAVKILAISTVNDQPAGFWYTLVPYGIGGDIVFEPRQTLSYLDLSTFNIKSYLGTNDGPAGVSDDQTWIAYTSSSSQGPLSIAHNLDFSAAITFPLREDSTRGSGEAIFSPDDHYVAWKEATGSLMDQPSTFHETIRVGTLDGTVITELADTSMLEASGFTEIGWVIPVGWLDMQTFALEVKDGSGENVCLISVKYDGTDLTYLAPGEFIGFAYP